MKLLINGVKLYFDIEGCGLAPEGPQMRQKPTLIVLHGGPGADHSIFKPHYGAALMDLCQILYLDHRGNGRSDDGDPALWTLDQWADDIAVLCDTLHIQNPIVLGSSFGGFVAQAYATRYPDRLSGLILSNTAAHVAFEDIFAAFERIAGPKAAACARTYWTNPTSESRRAYGETCVPHYTQHAIEPDLWPRIQLKDPVALHFNGPNNEMGRFDFRKSLAKVRCPSLVVSGEMDPIMPTTFARTLTDSLSSSHVLHHCLSGVGHLPETDAPRCYFAHLRTFVQRNSNAA